MSIRRRLLLALTLAVLAFGALAGTVTYLGAREQVNELFDYQLRQTALAARDYALARIGGGSVPFDPEQDFVVQARDENGAPLYLSHRQLPIPLGNSRGFDTVNFQGEDWRVFSVVAGRRVIQVAQPMQLRNRMVADAALRSVTPFAALLPLLLLVVWLTVGAGLRPLARVTQALAARGAGALSPVPAAGLPSEITPVVEALNDLLARLDAALTRERRFTADAAHELRTPLTALRLQAQLVERARSDTERAEAMTELSAGIQRATRLVEQLLAAARATHGGGQTPAPTLLALDAAARAVCGELASVAAAKAVTVKTQLEPVRVALPAAALHTLVANLIDNAIRYAPEGGHIAVTVRPEQERPVLTVTDDGPGIPADERGRVFDRFYRVPGGPGIGSGLGLAIVREIATAAGAGVTLEDGPGGRGLAVRVVFSPPGSPPAGG
jgi:two-component system OmpR family sensor kinase